MSVGMSRIVKLRRQEQDTSVRNVIKFLDLVVNLRHLQSHTNTDNKKCKCGRKFRCSDYFTEHLATCNENLMESTADFVPSFVQAHKEHLIDHKEETNADTTQ